MKRAVLLLLFLALPLISSGREKDPQIEKRKEFCHKVFRYLEQNTGWNVWVRIAPGNEQNILQMYPGADGGKLILLDGGANMTPERFTAFRREVVDALLRDPDFMKQSLDAGFVGIELKIASHSESYPKGVIDIALDKTSATNR